MNQIKATPLVTIVIPAYNHEKFVQSAIQSVLNQTYKNIQLLVINDGSTDQTARQIRAFQQKTKARFVFINKKNEGLGRTLNRGLALAKGKIFYYLASDDQLLPRAVEKIVAAYAQSSDEVGLIYCQYTNTHQPTRRILPQNLQLKGRIWKNILKNEINILGPVCFFKTEALRLAGGFSDVLILEDFYILLKITYQFKTSYLPEALVFYRLHSSNTSKSYRKLSSAVFLTIEMFFQEYQIKDPKLKKLAYATRYYWLAWIGFNNKDRSFALENYYQAFLRHPLLILKDLNFLKSFIRTLLNKF